MSLDLFRLAGGIDIQSDDLSSNVNILQGSGVPGGTTETNAAPIGSIWLRTDASGNQLQQYSKFTTVNGNSSDWTVLVDKSYVDNAIIGLSWREPVKVQDLVATTLPTGTAGNPITVDGVSVADGGRVLFSSLSTLPNVYIYNQTTGVFAQDANLATAGDALFVTEGTSLGQRWTYNGTAWVLFGTQTDVTEINYINTFIGKPSIGSVTPTYASNNLIVDGQSLTATTDAIDLALGSGTVTSSLILTSNLAFAGTTGAGGTLTVTAALNELNVAIGAFSAITNRDGNYPITTATTTVTGALNLLNNAVEVLNVNNLSTSVSISTTPGTYTTIDSIPVADVDQIKWLVEVRNTATPGNRRAAEVHAITDGSVVDFTRYAELKLGAAIAGYGVQVVIVGANVVLQTKATANYDVVVKRVAVSKF